MTSSEDSIVLYDGDEEDRHGDAESFPKIENKCYSISKFVVSTIVTSIIMIFIIVMLYYAYIFFSGS